jgi:hypothetical protein
VSISSISNPTALLSQVTGKNPLAVATPFGAGSFVSTLLQELRQSGASAAAGSAGATSATAAGATTSAAGANTTAGAGGTAATGALQARGHHHGHHAGGMSQLQLQALLQNLKNGASARPGQLLSTAV